MGSQLTKNYDVDKDPIASGGPGCSFKIHRAKRKDNHSEVSIFIFDKKEIDKKSSPSSREELLNYLKKDAQNLARLKHPNLLNLIEQPQEDNKVLVYVTEPIECSLADLHQDYQKRRLVPGELECKSILLEMMEALHFLHNTAKLVHLGLAPENIYFTREGKVRLAGFNNSLPAPASSSAAPAQAYFDYAPNGSFAAAPDLRFTAPEVTASAGASVHSDVFSLGLVGYYLLALERGTSPFVIEMQDRFSKG